MIVARKVPLFNFVLRRWLASVLRRRFHNVYLVGAENLRALDMAGPVLGCVNHSNWWDGFVLYVLSDRRLAHDIYLAMEEANLRRYRFFTWMGVFGLDLSAPRAGLRYAHQLLRTAARTPRLVWIFVQGELLGPHAPIQAKPGASFLARTTGAQILPLVLRYEWLLESRPSVFVNIGRLMPPETAPEALAAVLNGLFADLEAVLDPRKLAECEPLFPARLSINKRWDYFLHLLWRRREVFDRQNR